MRLAEVLEQVRAGEKTASAPAVQTATSTNASDTGAALKHALREASASANQKVAAAPSPLQDLTKIAAELSHAEHDAIVKEAQLYGAALCDGFMARGAQYKEAADRASEHKTAGYSQADTGFDKFASENPDLVKEAAATGYTQATAELEKLAGAAYDKGWNDTVEAIHKTASEAFTLGFATTRQLLNGGE